MDIVWRNGKQKASAIAAVLKREVGWSKTTTYTVIKKCVDKGAITREEPGFICSAAITRAQAQAAETEALINRLYDGSADQLVASLLDGKPLSTDMLEKLRAYVRSVETP